MRPAAITPCHPLSGARLQGHHRRQDRGHASGLPAGAAARSSPAAILFAGLSPIIARAQERAAGLPSRIAARHARPPRRKALLSLLGKPDYQFPAPAPLEQAPWNHCLDGPLAASQN